MLEQRRRPGADHDRRAGQAAGRGQGRGRLRRDRSSSGSPRRRGASTATRSRPPQRDKRILVIKQPIGVCGGDHAVELPDRDDHAQGRRRRWPPAARWSSSRRRRRRFSALALAELAQRAGVPAGCSTCAHRLGQPDRRRAERANPLVRKLTFTGSTEVGRMLMRAERGHDQEALASSSAAMRPSSCSTTPTSTRRSKARSISASSATPARPASAPTASTCSAACYDAFAEKLGGQGRRR